MQYNLSNWKTQIRPFDDRRNLIVLNKGKEAIDFCARQFIDLARSAIAERDIFVVALSGGSTPNAIFKELSQSQYHDAIDWNKVFLFWSDERSVPHDHEESNYRMAMEAGLSTLPVPKEHIFRMKAETNIEANALRYEENIRRIIPSGRFDLIMLGMGEDGHTASLFPFTTALKNIDSLVSANYIPQKETWRMTLTYSCIELARHVLIYVMGKSKAEMVEKALNGVYQPDLLPVQRIGTAENKATWIVDDEAAANL